MSVTDIFQADAASALPSTLEPPFSTSDRDKTPEIVRRRRRVVLALNLVTIAALLGTMVWLMSFNGVAPIEAAMLVPYALTLPWLSIGLWNAVIGLLLDLRHADAPAHVTPALARASETDPITTRTAIVMPLRNEDPDASLARLAAVEADLAATEWADGFTYHVLSDTDRPDIAAREERLVANWRRARPDARIVYRRRTDNSGYKAGNIAEWLARTHTEHDYFLPLDADSVMSAASILRLVRVMQVSPEIGMLQGIIVGMPSRSFFTRAFQFGMRHGMRSYTLGSAWWQADCGPSWGHNLLIRSAPFHAHCQLPVLEGKGPLSGYILSHDQIEAALMRRAGYECRVFAAEDESYEINPPSLVDFIRRELRWCNGNFQYFKLLGLPGLRPVSRLQVLLAIQMYVASPAWIVFLLLSAALAGSSSQFDGVPPGAGLAFFAVIMSLNLMPKLMGLAQVLLSPAQTARYGGRGRVVAGGCAEIVTSMLIAPAVAVSLTIFAVGLALGRRVGWQVQQRDRARLLWSEATLCLWPQTLLGAGLTLWLGMSAPWSLPFAAPILVALTLSIPLAVAMTSRRLGTFATAVGLFDIPEDRTPFRAAGPVGERLAA